jgi:5-methyltetrahydrofolate--homocysteine methyltransferase
VEQIHREYVDAGADCLLSNTFGANAIMLARHGLADMVERINRAGMEIALRAADGKALVVGSLGPTGGLLEPYGDLTADQVRRAYAEQVSALAAAGAQALIAETFESSGELALLLAAARECSDLPLIASMKLDREPSGRYRTMMGEGPDALVRVAEGGNCAALGSNCGQGIEAMVPLVKELSRLTKLPILVEPNAGLPRLAAGKTVYPESPSHFARFVPALYEAGARIIGGCCGTTANHIRAIRAFADSV